MWRKSLSKIKVGTYVKVLYGYNGFNTGDRALVVDVLDGDRVTNTIQYFVIPMHKRLCGMTHNCVKCLTGPTDNYCGMLLTERQLEVLE